ncbi:MAG: hypothetical protein ACFFDH_00720 [Promethearchaeota archaeon]
MYYEKDVIEITIDMINLQVKTETRDYEGNIDNIKKKGREGNKNLS